MKRYNYKEFPESIIDLHLLDLKFNKLSVLRDVLRLIGVHIEFKDYDLDF